MVGTVVKGAIAAATAVAQNEKARQAALDALDKVRKYLKTNPGRRGF